MSLLFDVQCSTVELIHMMNHVWQASKVAQEPHKLQHYVLALVAMLCDEMHVDSVLHSLPFFSFIRSLPVCWLWHGE